MKTFFTWAEEQGHDLNLVYAAPEGEQTDVNPGEDATGEQRVRTGYSGNYPPAYVSGQYPHKWFAPRKSTADLDAESIPGQPKGS
jgi:hypothetical protein